MNILKWLVGRFLPMEEGEEGGGEGDGITGGAEGVGGDPRPAWCPEKFYDPDIGVRQEELGKAYNELEGRIRAKTEDLREEVLADIRGNAPEKYELTLPEDLNVPENIKIDLDETDPLLQWFNGFAKEQGLSQEQYNEAVKVYIETEIAALPDVNAEIQKLGSNGQDRLQAVSHGLKDILSESEARLLDSMMTSAEGVGVLEKLLRISGPEDFEGDAGSSPLSLEELRAIQNKPEYWRDKDPQLIEKVTQGYKRLYGGG